MNVLNDEQRKRVTAWIQEGLKLSEIQTRIASELGERLTYMDVRLLVDDLKLTPKDIDRPKPVLPTTTPAGAPAGTGVPPATSPLPPENGNDKKIPGGRVTVNVDQIARAGTMVSGKVTFSDGNSAEWYFDSTGRLGLVPQQQGYRPAPADLQEFQMALETELSKMGF